MDSAPVADPEYPFIEDAINHGMAVVAFLGDGPPSAKWKSCRENRGFSCLAQDMHCPALADCAVPAMQRAIGEIANAKRIVSTDNWTHEAEGRFWASLTYLKLMARDEAEYTKIKRRYSNNLSRYWHSIVAFLGIILGVVVFSTWLNGRQALTDYKTLYQECDIRNQEAPDRRSICIRDAAPALNASIIWMIYDTAAKPVSDPDEKARLQGTVVELWIRWLTMVLPFFMGGLGTFVSTRNRWLSETSTDNVMNSLVRRERLRRRTIVGAILGGICGLLMLWGMEATPGIREMAWYLLISFAVGFQTRGIISFMEALSDKIGDSLKKPS